MLAGIAAAGGCLGRGGGPSESTPDEVDVREWPEEYYQGPLVSAHEHMNGPDGFSMTADRLDSFVRWMGRNRVSHAMAITHTGLVPVVEEHDDRLVPFCFPYDLLRTDLATLADSLARRLDEYPLYRGIGEFGLYRWPGPDGDPPLPANHPSLLDVYDLAAERDMPVMVHGGQPGQYGNGADPVAHMEAAFEHNRDCTFLVHGTFQNGVTIDGTADVPVGEAVATLLERHSNFYYDISGQASPYAYDWERPPDDDRDTVNPGERRSREWFESKLADRGGLDQHAERLYETFKPILEDHSGRVTWGMDASWQWHFNEWALDAWADIARSILGHLPEDAAADVGYRTAGMLFDIGVESEA